MPASRQGSLRLVRDGRRPYPRHPAPASAREELAGGVERDRVDILKAAFLADPVDELACPGIPEIDGGILESGHDHRAIGGVMQVKDLPGVGFVCPEHLSGFKVPDPRDADTRLAGLR